MNFSILLSSIIIILCIIVSKVSTKVGVPSLLLFLVLGMVFGTDGLLKINFDSYEEVVIVFCHAFDVVYVVMLRKR